jgi:hypothetical protein
MDLSGCAEHKRNIVCSNAIQAQKFSLSANKFSQENVTDVYWTLNMLTVEQKAVEYVSNWTLLPIELCHVYILHARKSHSGTPVLRSEFVCGYWRTIL